MVVSLRGHEYFYEESNCQRITDECLSMLGKAVGCFLQCEGDSGAFRSLHVLSENITGQLSYR